MGLLFPHLCFLVFGFFSFSLSARDESAGFTCSKRVARPLGYIPLHL